MGLLGDEKCLTVSLVVSIQYTNVDGQTDGRTSVDSKDRAMHSFARFYDEYLE